MSALFYYSISSGLNENEVVRIDKEVSRNRKVVYLFVTKLPLNAKRKGKTICLYVIFMSAIAQPLAPCVCVMFPTEIHRSYNNTQYSRDLYLTKLVSSNTTQVITKRTSGQYSIFVKAFQSLVSHSGRQKYIKVYDFEEGVEIRSSVMPQAYGKCNEENNKLPRQITSD
jgi:hypothetical protein